MIMTTRVRSALAPLLLAGGSILGCGSETPPPAAPAAPTPVVDSGPPSGAAADAAVAKTPKTPKPAK